MKEVTGIEMKERVPDRILQEADEVVNIDLTSEELIGRLKAGKIYRPEKIQIALDNFFRTENILQLRELALKEVAFRVEKKVETEVFPAVSSARREKILACISSNEQTPRAHHPKSIPDFLALQYVVYRPLRPDAKGVPRPHQSGVPAPFA